jgi:hypothetical protein
LVYWFGGLLLYPKSVVVRELESILPVEVMGTIAIQGCRFWYRRKGRISLRVMRTILAVVLVILSIWALITGTVTKSFSPYMLSIVGTIILFIGLSELKSKRKKCDYLVCNISICTFSFSLHFPPLTGAFLQIGVKHPFLVQLKKQIN